MAYKYLGYGVTNENGVAKLEYNSEGQKIDHSYTGVGAGEIDVVASLDNPVSSGSIVSEIYEVIDGTFKDIGTSSNYGTWTSTDFTGSKISRDTECTTLTPEDNYDAQQQSITGTDFAVELDCNLTYSDGTVSNAFLRFIASTNRTFNPNGLRLQSGNWHHLKFVVSNDTITVFVDNVDKGSQEISNPTAFRIVLNNTYVSNMKYKNFVYYPI